MKIRFLLLPLFAVMLFSCSKNDKPEEAQKPLLSSKNTQAISAASKVWHGERLQGNAPAPAGNGLSLDAAFSAPTTRAFAGRYAIIQPAIEQGDVAGYYLQFNGAKEYFKVDYSKPRGGRLQPGTKRPSPFGHDPRQSRVQGGNEDSAIVIALPANLQVPDTFCVTYCAYDNAGNVSNPITTCIIVSSLGTDAAGTWLHGQWRNTASWDSTFRDTLVYNKWSAESYNWGYVCRFDSFLNANILDYNYQNLPAQVKDSVYYTKSHINFGTNGGTTYDYQVKYKYVDLGNSTCAQVAFMQSDDQDGFTGAWNYNSATGKMTLVFEFDYNGLPTLEAWEYKVTKISNNNMVLYDDSFGYPYYIRFER